MKEKKDKHIIIICSRLYSEGVEIQGRTGLSLPPPPPPPPPPFLSLSLSRKVVVLGLLSTTLRKNFFLESIDGPSRLNGHNKTHPQLKLVYNFTL